MVKKWLKYFAAFLLILFSLLVIVLGTVWIKPGLLFRPFVAQKISQYLRSKGIDVSWESLTLNAQSLSFWRKRVHWTSQKICYRSDPAKGCAAHLNFFLDFSLAHLRPQITLSKVEILGASIHIDERRFSQSDPTKRKDNPPSQSSFLTPSFYVSDAALTLEELTYQRKEERITGKGNVQLVGSDRRQIARGEFSLTALQTGARMDGRGHFLVESLNSSWQGPYQGSVDIQASLPAAQVAEASFKIGPDLGSVFRYSLKANYHQKAKQKASLEARGTTDFKKIRGSLNGDFTQLTGRTPSLSLRACQFEANVEKKEAPLSFSLDCPGQMRARFRSLNQGSYTLGETRLPVWLEAHAVSEEKKDSSLIRGDVKLVFKPLPRAVSSDTPQGLVLASAHGSYKQAKKGKSTFQTEGALEVPHFEELVTFLYPTPWAIPAPLNALSGSLKIRWGNHENAPPGESPIPLSLLTQLHSASQRLFLKGEGNLLLRKKKSNSPPHLTFNLELTDVSLVLPYLSLATPPRLASDPRIHAGKITKTVKKRSTLSYDLQLDTPSDRPLTLSSNLADQKIPVSVHVKLSSIHGTHGSVRLEPFDIELFRRKASIRRFDLKLDPDPEKTEVNGRIRVTYADYTVHILIMGLSNHPQIKFLSEPPLPEDKVIAVLLFGKPPETLDEEEAASVGSTRAAITDKALSLASMYLLASTPVESIGYDPATGMFSAKVKLTDGTSLNIGTDMKELNEVGIRKRLGQHWTIVTYLKHPFEAIHPVTAFLEWTKAY